MPAYTLYKRIFAQLLLLCVCVAAVNTCPNRKLVITETQATTVQRADSGGERAPSVCFKGISQDGVYEIFKTGGSMSPASAAILFSLNLLNNAPGTAFYLPRGPRSSVNDNALPLFLKNGVLIV